LEKTKYECPDCGWTKETEAQPVRCGNCGSLNLERQMQDGRWIKADAADSETRLIRTKVEVVVPVKANVCYAVRVKDVTPEAIRKALLEKDSSDWIVDPNFYEFLGNTYRDVISRMTDEDIRKAVVKHEREMQRM